MVTTSLVLYLQQTKASSRLYNCGHVFSCGVLPLRDELCFPQRWLVGSWQSRGLHCEQKHPCGAGGWEQKSGTGMGRQMFSCVCSGNPLFQKLQKALPSWSEQRPSSLRRFPSSCGNQRRPFLQGEPSPVSNAGALQPQTSGQLALLSLALKRGPSRI